MTQHTTSDGAGVDLPDGSPPAWEAPEIAAVAILVAFFAVVIGSLATAIDVSVSEQGFIDPTMNIWDAIQFGTTWAEPLLAIILLGVAGLCWWQVETWSEESGSQTQDSSTALGHVRRARQISFWTLGGLIVTTVGAVAGIVALIGFNVSAHPGQVAWSRVIGAGAGVIADVVVSVAGGLVIKRLTVPNPRFET